MSQPKASLHIYALRIEIGTPQALTDKRLAALTSRLQMLLVNLGYTLWQDDEGTALHVEGHSVETLN